MATRDNREILYRCRKCRRILVTRKNDGRIAEDDDGCCKTFAQLEPILDDDNRDDSETPEWLISCFNENDWRKGKLCCPDCNGKVGSFNFIKTHKCSCGRHQTPPVYLYKSRIDICSPTPNKSRAEETTQNRDHFAILKKSINDEWMVVFDSKPTEFNFLSSTPSLSMKTNPKLHRKSQSWHALSSGSTTVSTWLATTLADVSSQLDAAASETKQALVETLDLAAAPVSSALRKGHRKTKSWSGSIKTTLSTLLNGFFSTREIPNAATATISLEADKELESSISDNGILFRDEVPNSVEANEVEQLTPVDLETVGKSDRISRKKKRKKIKISQDQIHKTKSIQLRSRSPSLISIIPDYLLCSICLDIFCLPQFCLPCRHVFCEPCLKLVAHSLPLPRNRLRTLCPLCRQIIRWTEPAIDTVFILMEPPYSLKYIKRLLDYEKQPSIRSLILPGIYQLKFVRRIISQLPESVVRYLEKFWVDYTPLVTLYSFCVSLLCLLFFFTLFLPCVYLTSWICKLFENFSNTNDFDAGIVFKEVFDFGALIISSGMVSLASIVIIMSIALYTLFIL